MEHLPRHCQIFGSVCGSHPFSTTQGAPKLQHILWDPSSQALVTVEGDQVLDAAMCICRAGVCGTVDLVWVAIVAMRVLLPFAAISSPPNVFGPDHMQEIAQEGGTQIYTNNISWDRNFAIYVLRSPTR